MKRFMLSLCVFIPLLFTTYIGIVILYLSQESRYAVDFSYYALKNSAPDAILLSAVFAATVSFFGAQVRLRMRLLAYLASLFIMIGGHLLLFFLESLSIIDAFVVEGVTVICFIWFWKIAKKTGEAS